MLALNALRHRIIQWMQRVPGPEPQPVVLVQRRVYVLPTAAGMGVLMMLFVMLLAALNYNLALGYAFTFLLAGAGVAHILASWRNLVGLSLAVQPEGECFAGGDASFRVLLSSHSTRDRQAIRLLDPQGRLLCTGQLPGGAAWSGHLTRPAAARGRLPVGRLTVETFFPLGWVRAWSYIEPDASTLVYPQPAGDLPREATSASQGSQAQQQFAGGEEEFAGLRERRPNDPPARIAWRRTARDGALLVKDFHSLAAEEGVLDWHALPAWMDQEARLSQLTRWLLAAQATNARITLRLPDGQSGPADGSAHYRQCLARLALFGLDEART